MTDPRFFVTAGPFTLAELAEIAGAEIGGGGAADTLFRGVAPLDVAVGDQVSFLDNPKYRDLFAASRAGAAIVAADMVPRAPAGMALLVAAEPYRAYAKVAAAFHPEPVPEPGVAPTASVDPTARLGPGCRIEPGAVVGAHAKIGARTLIGANAVVEAGVVIGDDTRIGACASLSHCLIGSRVIIHPGVRIGQDGFGFAMGPSGHLKVPQLGRVVVEDDVEIGANTTIDRGSGPDTLIGAGSKIDNLVQIAHNVQLGRGCIIVSQVGISGSTRLGDFVALGGQAGLTGHLSIGAGAQVAAQSGVMRDVAAGETVGGSPAMPVREWMRVNATLARMGRKGTKG